MFVALPKPIKKKSTKLVKKKRTISIPIVGQIAQFVQFKCLRLCKFNLIVMLNKVTQM